MRWNPIQVDNMFLRSLTVLVCCLLIACGGVEIPDPEEDVLPSAAIALKRLGHATFEFEAVNRASSISFHWDMGDGKMLAGPEIRHSYSTTGEFEVTLTLSNQVGETDSVSTTVHVRNTPPVATISARTESLRVLLNAAESFDVDDNIALYEWHINGKDYEGTEVSLTLDAPGTLDISLTVVDSFGEASTPLTQIMEVTGADNTTPEAIIDTLVYRNYLRLLGANSKDADGDTLTYQWSLSDGTTYSGDNIVHSFTDVGEYDITLRAFDGEVWSEAQAQVSIEEMDDVTKPYRVHLFEASLDLLRRCGYCHRNREPLLSEYSDIDLVDAELSALVLNRSPMHVYSFPSEQNGRRHQGAIGGREIDAGDMIREHLELWHTIVNGMAEYYRLETL